MAVKIQTRDQFPLADHAKVQQQLLDAVQCGIVLVDRHGKIYHCNSAAFKILDIAPKAPGKPLSLKDAMKKLASLKIREGRDKSIVEIEVAPGKFAEIHAAQAPSGTILTIMEPGHDTAERNATFTMQGEYRSLFENATCGIYRDHIDGTPVRCNMALARFNGYDSEDEYRKSVSHSQVTWYVDPGRAALFHHLMKTEGCVKDLVSEVYRHHTREKVWITENAWYVRNEAGDPVYIEGTIQDASERIATLEIIEQQANLDSLTGLASRRRFLRELETMVAEGKLTEGNLKEGRAGFSVYTIDLDRFKPINDIHGHATGDFVLKTVAQELLAMVQDGDLVARLGGDEFAILHRHVENEPNVSVLAEKIVALLRKPLSLKGFNLLVGASVGLASFPAHGQDSATLLGNADLALYKAKKSGGNTFRVFDAELRSRMEHRVSVEEELKLAVSGDQLELHYQPVVVAATGAIQGYEALMRWNHPTRGLLLPADFIQIAEDAGLMTELGNWAIACACRQGAGLPPDIKIAVNVSANQFRSASILEVVRKSLDETRLDPGRLILEITESVILSNEMIADTVYGALRGMGVQMALDDFGTVYSSLSYLQRFKFDKVKIDRVFVKGMYGSPANLAVVRAIIGIGRDLGINIIAEGVETEAQAQTLIAEGCPLLQGYLYGKPKPFNEAVNDLAIQRLRLAGKVAVQKQFQKSARRA